MVKGHRGPELLSPDVRFEYRQKQRYSRRFSGVEVKNDEKAFRISSVPFRKEA